MNNELPVDPRRELNQASASRASSIRAMFAAISHRYDFLNHFLSLGRDSAWRRTTAKTLRGLLPPSAIVADLCCGTGDLVFALRKALPGKVLGADFCHPMLQLARRKRGARLPEVHFLVADTLALPFRNGYLDAVTIAFGLRNLADIPGGLRQMHRVLKAGGWLAVLEFSRVQGPVLSRLFGLYFRHILPRLGTWISGVRGPYQYLFDSASHFPDQQGLSDILREAGFLRVRFQNLSGGVAALHVAQKTIE